MNSKTIAKYAVAAGLVAGCQQDPGQFQVVFEWADGAPAAGSVWIHARVEERAGGRDAPGQSLRAADPVAWSPDLQLSIAPVLHGDDRVVVVEVYPGEEADGRPSFFGLSEPFSLQPGDDKAVPVYLEIAPTPSLQDAVATVEITNDNELSRIGTPLAELKIVGEGIARIEVAKDADFQIDAERYEAADVKTGTDGEREVFELTYDLNKNLDCANGCDGPRQIAVRARNAQGYPSEVISLRVVLDTVGPRAANVRITPQNAKEDDEVFLTFVTDETVIKNQVELELDGEDPGFVLRGSESPQQVTFSFLANASHSVGGAPTEYRLARLTLTDDLGNVSTATVPDDAFVIVDAKAPEIDDVNVTPTLVGNTIGQTIQVDFTVSEALDPDVGLSVTIERPSGTPAQLECTQTPQGTELDPVDVTCSHIVTGEDLDGPRALDNREILIQVLDRSQNRDSEVGSVVFDLEPPALETLSFSPGAARGGTDVVLSVFLSDELDPAFAPSLELGYAPSIDGVPAPVSTNIALTSVEGRAYLYRFPITAAVPDGYYRVLGLTARDVRSNTATITAPLTLPALSVDSVPPELSFVEVLPDPPIVGIGDQVSVTVEMTEALVATTTITLGGVDMSNCTTTATTSLPIQMTCTTMVTGTEIPAATTQSLAVVATTVDPAGNRTLIDTSVLFDFAPPVARGASLNPSFAREGTPLFLEIVLDEPVVNPPATIDLVRMDGTTLTLNAQPSTGAALTYRRDISVSAPQGVFFFEGVTLTDAQGNTGYVEAPLGVSVEIDTIAPAVTNVSVMRPVAPLDRARPGQAVDIAFDVNIAGEATPPTLEIVLAGETISAPCPQTATQASNSCSTTITTAMIDPNVEEIAPLVVRARDAAGNEAVGSATIVLDRLAPSLAATNGVVFSPPGAPTTVGLGAVATLTLNASERLAITPTLTMTPSNPGFLPEASATGQSHTFTYQVAANATDTTYTLTSVVLRDLVGNVRTVALTTPNTTRQVAIDPNAPTISPAVAVTPARVRRGTVVTATFGADEAASINASFDGAAMSCTPSSFTTQSNVTCTYTVPANQPIEERGASVVVQVVDDAGNAQSGSANVVIDTLPPDVVAGTEFVTLVPDAGNPLGTSIGSLRTGASALVHFNVSEELGPQPTVTAVGGPQPIPIGQSSSAGLSYTYELVVGPTTPEVSYGFSVVLEDLAGNVATHPLAVDPTVVDRSPPAAPNVLTPGRVTFTRRVWGSLGSPTANHTLAGQNGAVEAGALVRAHHPTTGIIGTTNANGNGAFSITNMTVDTNDLEIDAIDDAGNPSPRVDVLDGVWAANLNRKLPGTNTPNPHTVSRTNEVIESFDQVDVEINAAEYATIASAAGVVGSTAGLRWENVQPDVIGPGRRSDMGVAYDQKRGVIVLFGGFNGQSLENDTWEWDGHRWQEVTPLGISPSPRRTRMVYDSRRERVVMVAGGGLVTSPESDVWEWNGSTWTDVTPPGVGPTVTNHGIAYDSRRGVVIVQGGFDGTGLSDQTWEWDGTSWTMHDGSVRPYDDIYPGVAFDENTDSMIMFGGADTGLTQPEGLAHDVWIYEPCPSPPPVPNTCGASTGMRWRHAVSFSAPPPAGTWPADRSDPMITFHRGLSQQRLLMFGGEDRDTGMALGDVWAWDSSIEQWVTPGNGLDPGPQPRFNAAMTHFGANDELFVFGGFTDGNNYLTDVSAHDGSRWIRAFSILPNVPSPTPTVSRRDHMMVGGPVVPLPPPPGVTVGTLPGVLAFGGRTDCPTFPGCPYPPEILHFNGFEWVAAPTGTPGAPGVPFNTIGAVPSQLLVSGGAATRAGGAGAPRDQVFVFGGEQSGGARPNVLTVYDGSTLSQRFPNFAGAPWPTSRVFASMAYDWDRDRILLYGGVTNLDPASTPISNNDNTWVYNPGNNTWTRYPSASPPGMSARGGAALAYDPNRQGFVLQGGNAFTIELAETWLFRLHGANAFQWVPITTTTQPPARTQARLAFDPSRDALVLLGGTSDPSGNTTPFNDSWELGTTDWRLVRTVPDPAPMASHGLAVSSLDDHLIAWGGIRTGLEVWKRRDAATIRPGFFLSFDWVPAQIDPLDITSVRLVGSAGGSASGPGMRVRVWNATLGQWELVAANGVATPAAFDFSLTAEQTASAVNADGRVSFLIETGSAYGMSSTPAQVNVNNVELRVGYRR